MRRFLARHGPSWTLYALVSGLLWLTFSSVGVGAPGASATAAGESFGWVYTVVLGLVTVMGLGLLVMRRRV